MFFYAVGTHPAPSEGEKAVLWARQLPADRRQVNFLVSETVLRRSTFGVSVSLPYLLFSHNP